MTVQSLDTKVRGIINDSVQPYRWSQSRVKEYLQLAVRRLNVVAPHTRYLADGSIVDEVELPNDNNAVVPVSNRYEEALAYYAAHLCYLLDDPDTANAELANTYLAKAERLMT